MCVYTYTLLQGLSTLVCSLGGTIYEEVTGRGVFLLVFCFVFCLFRAEPAAYGGSQARGLVGAMATGLY